MYINSVLDVFLLLSMFHIMSAEKTLNNETIHKMTTAWMFNPIFGVFGTLLNSFILYIFYSERQTFIKPVNAMIW